MKIYFVRHAEPDYESELYGHGLFPGPPLTALGQKQAKDLSKRLTNTVFDAIFCSDYIRTIQTIEPSKPILSVNINYDTRLREVSDVLNEYLDYNNFPESQSTQTERLDSFASELSRNNYNTILIISHFNTIEYLSRKFGKHIKKPQFAEIHCIEL